MDQRVDDAVVATSENESAPEHRFQITIRREFDRDLAVTKLIVLAPEGQCLELTDARQLEILVALSQQALPRLQQAQEGIDREWRRWRAALESASAE